MKISAEARRRVAEVIWKADENAHEASWRDVNPKWRDHYDRLALAAIDALAMTEEWAVRDRYGIAVSIKNGHDGAVRMAERINADYAQENKYVAGAIMCAPNAEPVVRLVSQWRTPGGDA